MLEERPGLLLMVVLLVALLAPTSARGQTTGRIAGVVRDPSGAVIAGAEIVAINPATGEKWNTSTDQAGYYSLLVLPPGTYTLRITAPAFQGVVFSNVPVIVTETTTVNASLRIGATAEAITVRSPPPLLQKDGPALGRVVDSPSVSELPLASRNITQILGLSPGTATYLPDNTGVGRNTQTISVNGARMTQNNYQINGIDANTMGTSSAVNVAVPAPESVRLVHHGTHVAGGLGLVAPEPPTAALTLPRPAREFPS
jgi:hypothetical protein